MSFLGLQTPKNARDHPIIVWHPWRLFLAILFATKMGSKFQKVMGNPNPQGSSKMSWVWAYLAGQHTASCRVSIVVLLNTIQVRHPSVTFVAVAFVDQSQMKRLYKYIHIRYKYIYIYISNEILRTHINLTSFQTQCSFPVSLPCHCIAEKQKKHVFLNAMWLCSKSGA